MSKHSTINEGWGSKVFTVLNTAFFLFFGISIIFVFWNTFVMSISPEVENSSFSLRLFPKQLDFTGYKIIWTQNKVNVSFFINVYITVVGTLLHVFLSTLAGYALTKPKFPGKNAIMSFIMFSMIIPGQLVMVPLFVTYRYLNLINDINALVVSGLISGFSIIVMRNYFLSVPYSLQESGKIDGASEFGIFWRIYLPISLPGLATITLFQIVAKWNTFFEGILFINDMSKQPLQVVLREVVSSLTNNNPTAITSAASGMFGKNVQSAAIVISIIPLIAMYPFMQRYFIKGIMSGSVKG